MGEAFTTCSRCGGVMSNEKIYSKTEHFWVWRCIHCGEYVDRVILENRALGDVGGVPETRNKRKWGSWRGNQN
jgi:hypothetical protein